MIKRRKMYVVNIVNFVKKNCQQIIKVRQNQENNLTLTYILKMTGQYKDNKPSVQTNLFLFCKMNINKQLVEMPPSHRVQWVQLSRIVCDSWQCYQGLHVHLHTDMCIEKFFQGSQLSLRKLLGMETLTLYLCSSSSTFHLANYGCACKHPLRQNHFLAYNIQWNLLLHLSLTLPAKLQQKTNYFYVLVDVI